MSLVSLPILAIVFTVGISSLALAAGGGGAAGGSGAQTQTGKDRPRGEAGPAGAANNPRPATPVTTTAASEKAPPAK